MAHCFGGKERSGCELLALKQAVQWRRHWQGGFELNLQAGYTRSHLGNYGVRIPTGRNFPHRGVSFVF